MDSGKSEYSNAKHWSTCTRQHCLQGSSERDNALKRTHHINLEAKKTMAGEWKQCKENDWGNEPEHTVKINYQIQFLIHMQSEGSEV